MEFYFTKNNYKTYFLVNINNSNVEISRVDNKEKIAFNNVEKIFIGEHCLIDDINNYDKEVEKGNSILLQLKSDNQNYKYIFIGHCVYSFETIDEIVKFSSNLGFSRVQYAAAYGEQNIYYLTDRYEYIPYDTIEDENIKNKDLSYCPYDLLYNSNDGERNNILNLTLIAPIYEGEIIENYLEYEDEENNINELIIAYENEVDEIYIWK